MIGLFANVWISWGIGKHFQLISVNAICASLVRDTSRAMSLFHSFILLVVTPPLASTPRERNPLWQLRCRIVRLQMRSFILLITYTTTRTRRTPTSSCFSVLMWFSMTRQKKVQEREVQRLLQRWFRATCIVFSRQYFGWPYRPSSGLQMLLNLSRNHIII